MQAIRDVFDTPEVEVEAAISLLSWMYEARSLLAPERHFDEDNHRYLSAIYEDDCQEMVLCKAGQVGVSEYLLSWILWSADVRRATGLYVFPTDGTVSDFSAARLGPAIEPEVSSYLAEIVRGAQAKGSYRGADRVGLKRIRDRFIYFRGAKVQPDGRAPQLRAIDADVLILDEYDEMDRRAPAIAEERLAHSKLAQVRKASTPTYADVGIHAEYLRSDQRRWFVRCLSCDQAQDLRLEDLVIEMDDLGRPLAWHQDADKQPFVACRHCGGEMDRLGSGEWVAAYPDRPVHGYHLSRLFSPHRPLVAIIEGLKEVDETKRQQVFNQGLGEPYRSSSATALTDAVLDECRREYGLGTSKGRKLFCGVDVGRVLHVVIREVLPDGNQAARFIGDVPDFDELGKLLRRYKVQRTVIDALPETRSARLFQATFARLQVWLAYYPTGIDKKVSWAIWNSEGGSDKDGTVYLDRTRSLDDMLAQFFSAARGEAGNTLPGNARDLPDYYAHLKATERQFRSGADGNRVAVYVKSGPDHYAHAENYCNAAASAGVGVFFG